MLLDEVETVLTRGGNERKIVNGNIEISIDGEKQQHGEAKWTNLVSCLDYNESLFVFVLLKMLVEWRKVEWVVMSPCRFRQNLFLFYISSIKCCF